MESLANKEKRQEKTLRSEKTPGPPQPQQDSLHRFLSGRTLPIRKRRARAPERWTRLLPWEVVFCIPGLEEKFLCSLVVVSSGGSP